MLARAGPGSLDALQASIFELFSEWAKIENVLKTNSFSMILRLEEDPFCNILVLWVIFLTDLVVGVVLERFVRDVAHKATPGGSRPYGVLHIWTRRVRKCRPKGRFLDPRKIENRSKTALWRIDGHFGRPKK